MSAGTFLCSAYIKYACAKKYCLPCLKPKFLRLSSKSIAISGLKSCFLTLFEYSDNFKEVSPDIVIGLVLDSIAVSGFKCPG